MLKKKRKVEISKWNLTLKIKSEIQHRGFRHFFWTNYTRELLIWPKSDKHFCRERVPENLKNNSSFVLVEFFSKKPYPCSRKHLQLLKAEQPDHVQFNSQIIRQNEQRADSLEALNFVCLENKICLENLFRKQIPDNQLISTTISYLC